MEAISEVVGISSGHLCGGGIYLARLLSSLSLNSYAAALEILDKETPLEET